MTDPTRLDPARTALLVMDFQNGLVDHVPDSAGLLDRAGAAIADVRARGGQVAWVRVGFDEADFAAMPPTSVMAATATPDRKIAMHADAPGTQIHPSLAGLPGDIVVRKTRVGAFSTTDLDEQLRDRGVDSLVMAGISTSGVVLSTVREAMDRDYRIVVLDDACGDPDPEVHTFLTGRIYPRHTTVVTVDGLAALWA